jgi:RHS repeat-associated protein
LILFRQGINRYHEVTGSLVITSYYLGGKLIAQRQGSGSSYILSYFLQDHLRSTSATYDSNSNSTSIKYFPFGLTRSSAGTLPTDKKFTGQQLDSTGLYYYNARYYDASIGRFISPDTIVPDSFNPQSLNRYSYC